MAAGLGLAGCDKAAPPEPELANSQTADPKPAVPSVPRPAPALNRQDLIDAAARAASDYAEQRQKPSGDSLVGRSFAVRIAFGCNGPTMAGSEEPGVAHWTWGEDRKTIRLALGPADWKESAMIAQAGANERWEAVEGFWIPRPWLRSEACSAIKGDPLQTVAAPSPRTLGIAAVFDAGGSRVGRRDGRPYQFVLRADGQDAVAAPADGFRLLLAGRVEAFPSGRAIECRASSADQRPVCVVATRLDRVAFEQSDGENLVEWRTD